MKLELKYLAPYLPYGLRIAKGLDTYRDIYSKVDISRQFNDSEGLEWDTVQRLLFEESWKPLLLPMSSLYTEMEDGKVPIVELYSLYVYGKVGMVDARMVKYYPSIVEDRDNPYTLYHALEIDHRESFILLPNGSMYLSLNKTWTTPMCPINFYPNKCHDYLDSQHFDWRYGLIDKGLALDKTKIK